jgi:hypothetical protein
LSAFNDLTGNSGLNAWSIGRARFEIAKMRLVAPSSKPIISAANLINPDIVFVSDPFRIVVQDSTYIFAEAWSLSAQRGQIAVFQMKNRDQVVASGIVLAEPFHLSYPCVFKHQGYYYMLPEAWENGQLVLYKAEMFPWVWRPENVLLELDYADPQIFFYHDCWYIFLNTDPLRNATASVFWSDSLRTNWRAHPQNPIFHGDSLRARSAGPFIRHRERIVRFSQDCRQQYGQSVFASEIVELSPTTIRMKSLGEVGLDRPDWAQGGFHHVDVFLENGVHHALFDGYSPALEPQPQQIGTEFQR